MDSLIDTFADEIVEDLDILIDKIDKKLSHQDIGSQAIKMLLKFEIGKYFLDKQEEISEKGKKIAKMIYDGLDEKLEKEMINFGFSSFEIVSSKKLIIIKVGEKLYNENRLE